MKISKTLFKEYTRCEYVPILDQIYKLKLMSSCLDDERKEEILSSMFDEETGDDLIEKDRTQLDIMLPYYQMVEQHAMEIATKKFDNNILYNIDTKKQKCFSFKDDLNEYYCYLDGYQENIDGTRRIFEVKSTTSSQLEDLNLLFTYQNGMYTLNPIPKDEKGQKKYYKQYERLFNRYDNFGKYVFDLAIERFIVEKATKENSFVQYYLCILNHRYHLNEPYHDFRDPYLPDQNQEEVICFVDLTSVTKEYLKEIERMYHELTNCLKNNTNKDFSPLVGKYCERMKPTECLFVPICWKKFLKEGSILEYIRISQSNFEDEQGQKHYFFDLLNKENKTSIDDIPYSWLEKKNHIIQYDCYQNKKEYINIDKIKAGFNKGIVYPIYHLDFESFNSPLPRFYQETPYMQSLFQFSIHIERSQGVCDIEKDHVEFLAENNNQDCRKALIEKMIQTIDLSKGGTVLVYNQNFERNRIKELSEIFVEYKQELENINHHMFDLMFLLKGNKSFYESLGYSEEEASEINYYHNDLHGSYSIKKVLPIFSDLSYKTLSIKNGLEAQVAYAKFDQLSSKDLADTRNHLKIYCRQDTWSMVVILWGLLKK